MCCDEIPRIFLTAPPLSAAVALDLGPCEQRLRYAKLATSACITSGAPHTMAIDGLIGINSILPVFSCRDTAGKSARLRAG